MINPPVVRLAAPSDRSALARFRCALGDRWYELEVEEHVNTDALDAYLWKRGHNEHRLLLFARDDGELVAVGATEIGNLSSGGTPIANTYVDFIAVRLEFRRHQVAVADERRVGEYVLDVLIADAVEQRPADEVIYATIAHENERARELVRSRGFTRELPHEDERYGYYLGRLPGG